MLGGQGCQRPQEPHPEAGTSESCLPGLATGGAGGVHLSPWSEEQGGHTALPRADEPWRLGGEGTEATARSEEGTCSWHGLVWRGGKA